MTVSTIMTRLMANARMRLPGVLDDPLKYELFNTLDEFFQFSDIWVEEIDFDTVVGEVTYEIEPESAGGTINRLMSLFNVNLVPVGVTMGEIGTLILTETPTTVDTLTATVSLSVQDPTRTDGYPQCPEWILQKYNLRLLDGVLSRVMTQPAKPYTNPQLAAYHARVFNTAKSAARVEARTANLNGGQAWRFPRSFG